MNKLQAALNNHKTYDADRPCRAGHWPTKRYVSTGNCVSCLQKRPKAVGVNIRRAVVPPSQNALFDQMCAAMGWQTNVDAPPTVATTHDPNGLDTGWRPSPPPLPEVPKGVVFMLPGGATRLP